MLADLARDDVAHDDVPLDDATLDDALPQRFMLTACSGNGPTITAVPDFLSIS